MGNRPPRRTEHPGYAHASRIPKQKIDNLADWHIELSGAINLTKADFLL